MIAPRVERPQSSPLEEEVIAPNHSTGSANMDEGERQADLVAELSPVTVCLSSVARNLLIRAIVCCGPICTLPVHIYSCSHLVSQVVVMSETEEDLRPALRAVMALTKPLMLCHDVLPAMPVSSVSCLLSPRRNVIGETQGRGEGCRQQSYTPIQLSWDQQSCTSHEARWGKCLVTLR